MTYEGGATGEASERPKLGRAVRLRRQGCDLAAAVAHCFPGPDPLVVELCACEAPPAWVDPMLKELAASLVMSPSAGAPAPGRSTVLAAASEVDASLTDTCSPVMAIQRTMGLPPLSLVRELPKLTPPRVG